jgi:uncharacterized MnhB-related membrane protein
MRSAQRPIWQRFAIIFAATFLGCLVASGLLLVAWAYTYYEMGGGFVVHLNSIVLGAMICAAAVATLMTISRHPEK